MVGGDVWGVAVFGDSADWCDFALDTSEGDVQGTEKSVFITFRNAVDRKFTGVVVDVASVKSEHLNDAAHDEGQDVELMRVSGYSLHVSFGGLSRPVRMAAGLGLETGGGG